jgi:hypothetical protein
MVARQLVLLLCALGCASTFNVAPGNLAHPQQTKQRHSVCGLARSTQRPCFPPLVRCIGGSTATLQGCVPGRNQRTSLVHPRVRKASVVLSASAESGKQDKADDGKLPKAVIPICLGVFVQMLGEGIAISSIPLHLKGFGASAVQVGLATSAFSVAQMICCPLIVKLSSKVGRTRVLRICLSGATAASFVITLSPTIEGVIFGRFLAGIFAASVPVAQAGVTDIVTKDKSALALSRVASANQMGIVVGPAMSAFLAYVFGLCGLAANLQMRAVFFVSGLFALIVLAIDKMQVPYTPSKVEKEEEQAASGSGPPQSATLFRRQTPGITIKPHPQAQIMLRCIALVIGWSLTIR